MATLSRALSFIFPRAEDAVQEAYLTALERWTIDGVPRNPVAWIVTTARNRGDRPAAARTEAATKSSSCSHAWVRAVAAVPELDVDDDAGGDTRRRSA